MSLPPGFLDDLRNRVPISRIVGRKVTWDLRKSNQAKGDWWAPCPFHGEKTASFHVDDQKGFYHCFGCHASGDAIKFLRESDGMGFMDAVAVLAAEAGVPMPERSPQEQARTDRRAELTDVMDRAVRWFRLQLQTGAGADARDYLASRGLDADALERFEIGFAPDLRQGLLRHLTESNIPEAMVVQAGLAIKPEDRGGAPYDRFRGRIIFPIRDARGRCISFGGRAMDPNARAKYLNGPETSLFDKGRNLYNLGPARTAVAKGQPLVVAEGYMDVIALDRAGIEGAVAPLGTAITEDQLRLMWRVSPEPIIALDGDTAGLRAAMRLIDMALPLSGPGQALRFALMPAGQDPDDLIRAGGAGAMRAVLDQAQPLVDLLWRRETEGKVFDSPERKAALDKALGDAVARIPDAATREHYAAELKRKRWELFSPTRNERGRFARRGDPPPPSPQTRASTLVATDPGEALIEAVILALCATHPHLIAKVESRLERLEPVDPGRAALVHDLLAGSSSAAGRAALDEIKADPHVRSAPAIAYPASAADTAEPMLLNALDRIEARRAARDEVARAEVEIEGLADEGLTWRVTQSARARQQADHPDLGGDSGVMGDQRSLADQFAAVRAQAEALMRGRRR